MLKVFASGSCRIVSLLHNGYDLISPIHTWIDYHNSINYLSFYHNSKQHIQFISYIKELITIDDSIISNIMIGGNDELNNMRKERLLNIKKEFDLCDVYILEISSLKIKVTEKYYVNIRESDKIYTYLQTSEELYNDLIIIRNIIDKNKKIIFTCHFRPNIIYNDESKKINNREIIYYTLEKFCSDNKNLNVIFYDPSNFLKGNTNYIEDMYHYNQIYNKECFLNLYENYIK